jgi:hypothetical protein
MYVLAAVPFFCEMPLYTAVSVNRNEIFNFMSIHYQISANKCEHVSESERTSKRRKLWRKDAKGQF